MKKTQILKQAYEVGNNFDTDAMFVALQSQINNQIFRELIQKEKHSITLEFRVFVNEEEREDKDPRLVELVDCVQSFKDMLKQLDQDGVDLVELGLNAHQFEIFKAWRKSANTVTSKY